MLPCNPITVGGGGEGGVFHPPVWFFPNNLEPVDIRTLKRVPFLNIIVLTNFAKKQLKIEV